jgi:hypothetical protein
MNETNGRVNTLGITDGSDKARDKVNIFISHKSEDRKTAEKIIEILKQFDNPIDPKISFFISYEIPGGDRWYDTIRRNLIESNLLLLLFTDATRNWDWCLYEAGLFDRLEDEPKKNRVICLHSLNAIPDPLKHLQGFSAKKDKMIDFLKQLFTTTELTDLPEPINPMILNLPDVLEKQALKLTSLLQKGVAKTNWFCNYFFLDIDDPEKLDARCIPANAKVTADEQTLKNIFGIIEGKTWKEIEDVIPDNDDKRWIQDLAKAMHAISINLDPEPIGTTFTARKGVKLYQPSLYRIDKKADGSMVFKILLTEDISFRLNNVPPGLAELMTAIIMATRFRFELLNEYLLNGDSLKIDETFENACSEIRQIIVNIEKDALSRGLLDSKKVADMFEEKESKEKINSMFDDWVKIREKIMDYPQNNEEDVARYLKKLMGLNKEFLTLANYRYAEIMAQ